MIIHNFYVMEAMFIKMDRSSNLLKTKKFDLLDLKLFNRTLKI